MCTSKSFCQLQYQCGFFPSCFDSLLGLVCSCWRNVAIAMTYMGMPVPMPWDAVSLSMYYQFKCYNMMTFVQEEKEDSSQLLEMTSYPRTKISQSPGNHSHRSGPYSSHIGNKFYGKHMPEAQFYSDAKKQGGLCMFLSHPFFFFFPIAFCYKEGRI